MASGGVPKDISEWESVIGSRAIDLFRRSDLLCDVVVIVDGQRFPYSRMHLAAHSLYFRTMFTGSMSESQKREVPIEAEVSAETFELILLYIGAEEFRISATNICGLIRAADFLQV